MHSLNRHIQLYRINFYQYFHCRANDLVLPQERLREK